MNTIEHALDRVLGFAISRNDDMTFAILLFFNSVEESDQHLNTILNSLPSDHVAVHLNEISPNKFRLSLINTLSGDIYSSKPGIPVIKSAILRILSAYQGSFSFSSGFWDSELKAIMIPKGNATKFVFSSLTLTEDFVVE